jgi:hypothetical protein
MCAVVTMICRVKLLYLPVGTSQWSVAPPVLTSALDGSELSASLPDRFTPSIHRFGVWMGPKVGLDAVEKRKIEPGPFGP